MEPDSDWSRLVSTIGDLPRMVSSADWERAAVDTLRVERDRYLLRFLAAGIRICIEANDTSTPQFISSIEDRACWGLDNPDCNYRYCRIDPAGTYLVSGTLGSAALIEFQVNSGHHADGDFAGWQAVSSITGPDLHPTEGDHFDLVLSAERPADARDWIALDERASFLLVRQYFNDWAAPPARLAIERLDTSPRSAPLTSERAGRDQALLEQWLTTGARCWQQISDLILASDPGDIQPFLPPDSDSGLKGQAYGFGAWRCGPGEAVILRVRPPKCLLWGVSLCDRWWQSIDLGDRQSSLNGAQSASGPDDSIEMVIAHDDPGIVNWLDPGGRTEGTLAVRYLLSTEGEPLLHYEPVLFDALASHLDADTPRCTSEERERALRLRHRSIQHRYGR